MTGVHPISRADIEAARDRIGGVVIRSPLLRLAVDAPGRDVFLKLENLQPTNSFKIRGAANAVAKLDERQRARGVWTVSAGNAGQGVAYAARSAKVSCTVVTIETAPETKVERMRALGARLVKAPFDACWQAMERREFPGVDGTFIHPFDDDDFIAGNATIGVEILEDLPDVDTVLTAFGGGGLIAGVASGLRAFGGASVRVMGAEPETAAPAHRSFEHGTASKFEEWQPSFVDGAGGKSVFPRMWDRIKDIVAGSLVVSLDETRRAMRTLAESARVVAEGAGALPVAAALSGRAGSGRIVAVVSGGNLDLTTFCEIITS